MTSQQNGVEDGSLADEAIIRRVIAGETALFELLMRRYNQRLFRVVRSIVRTDAAAEDAMQEAYLRAYLNLRQYEGRGRFAAWLTRIALHEALRVRKDQARWFQLDTQDEERGGETPFPVQKPVERDVSLQTTISASIENLSPALRVVFILRQVEDLSVAETAESLGISEGSVKTRFHRARTSLRDSIGRSLGSELQHVYGFDGARCDRIVRRVLDRIRVN